MWNKVMCHVSGTSSRFYLPIKGSMDDPKPSYSCIFVKWRINVKVSDVKTVGKNGHATLVSKAETSELQKIAKTGNWWLLRKKLQGGGRHI